MDWVFNLVLGWVPWWAWALVALVLLGGVWKWFGWQGLVAASLGIAAFFGYRQGWNDSRGGKPPIIPVDPIQVRPPEPVKKKKKLKTLADWWNEQRKP